MPAYWVARAKINDPVEYKKYTDKIPALLAKYGGTPLARGGRYQIMTAGTNSIASSSSNSTSSRRSPASLAGNTMSSCRLRRSGAGEVETVIVGRRRRHTV